MLLSEDILLDMIEDDLSAGIVNLELPREVIKRNLDRALMLSSDYFNYTVYKTVSLTRIDASSGYVDLTELDGSGKIPTIINVYPITQIANTGANLLGLGSTFIMQQSDYNSSNLKNYALLMNKLSAIEGILGRGAKVVGDRLLVSNYLGDVTVEYIPNVITVESINEGTWVSWLIEYTVALGKRQLAMSRGKYKVNSNQFSTNADELLRDANEAIARLDEELKGKGILLASRG